MPEEIKGLLRVLVDEYAEMRDVVHDLDVDVRKLAGQYRRDKAERAAIVLVLLVSIVLVGLYVWDAAHRRAEFRGELHDLACLAVRRTPDGLNGTVDDLRRRYDCPAYRADSVTTPAAPPATRTMTSSVTATATATASMTLRPAASTVTVAGGTVTRTRTVPVTRTRTQVETRVVTVTATPSCRLLPGVLC